MNIARMEKFEQLWANRHDLPAESLAQYRFESREGYRLPELAVHYRTFVDTLESIVIRLPDSARMYFNDAPAEAYTDGIKCWHGGVDTARLAIEAAGLKVAE